MDIRNSIKNSFIINLFIKLKFLADHSVLFNINSNNKKVYKPKKYRTWVDYSIIYKVFMTIDKLLMKFEGHLNKSFKNSSLLKPLIRKSNKKTDVKIKNNVFTNSYIFKIFLYIKDNFTWSILLIFIPTAYVIVDYIIRRVGILARFGSIWDELLLLFLVAFFYLKRILSGGKTNYNFTPMDLPLIIYILVGISHVFIKSPNIGIAIEGFRAVFQHVLWYFIATQFIRSISDAEKVIDLMLSIGLFLGVHSVYQYIAKVPMPGNWVDSAENITTRAFSIIGSPNILGVIFVLFIPIGISMLITNNVKFKKLFYLISTLFMIAGLLLTMSRGAWLAIAFSIFIYIAALKPKLLIPFTGLGAMFILIGGTLSERLLYMMSPVYLMKSAAGGRLYRWEIGLEIWRRNKLFGLGLGRYGGAVAINNNLTPFYLDNYYLKTLTEMGLFGIIGLGFLIICFIIFSVKLIRSQENMSRKILVIGLFSGCIGVLAQNFVENIFEVPAMIVYFWIVVALINTFKPKVDSH